MIYGAESWTLTNTMDLNDVRKENTEKVHGPSMKLHWRIKLNQGIYNKFKSPDSVAVIKVHRLERHVHVLRMDGTRAVKELLDSKPRGGKKN